jgi:prophage DNA circulation protein
VADLFEQTLLIGSYEGVFFPVIGADTTGGHTIIRHKAYKRRGADCEPTGQDEYSGTLQIALINGLRSWDNTLFPDVYNDLIKKFESTPIGNLSHPTKGTFTAGIEKWREHLTGKAPRNGVILDVPWVEHNGLAAVLPGLDGQSAPTNTTNAATIQATQADAAMAAVSPAVPFQSVSATIDAQLTFLDAQTRSYTEILGAISSMLVLVEANLALPGLGLVTAYPAVVALESLRATVYALRDRYLGTQAQPRIYTVPHTSPLWSIAFELYGDSSKAQLLATVNSLIDPLFVPAGRKLLVPPV